MKKRYKLRKEQLERMVENFVNESAGVSEKHFGVNDTPNHAKEAKKHKMSMGDEQSDDVGEGMKKPGVVKNPKLKQATEVKKHIKGSVSESEEMEEGRLGKFFGSDREGLYFEKLEDLKSKGYTVYTKKHETEEDMTNFARSKKFKGEIRHSLNPPLNKTFYFQPEEEIRRGSATSAGLSRGAGGMGYAK
jgi:hypothetical protein